MALPPSKLIGDLEFLRKLAVAKFLLVDDHRNMVKTIENMLVSICSFKRKSQSIFRAYNGKEALQIIVEQSSLKDGYIDLVFLDWNMPMVPGIDVLRAIRGSKNPNISKVPIIMITGEMRDKDVSDAVYEGVDGYLIKPFLEDDVRRRMNPIIRSFWSNMEMKRAENKRSEVRYPSARLKMKVDVEFANGNKEMLDVKDISKHGARLSLGKDSSADVKAISFPDMENTEQFVYRVNAVACPVFKLEGSEQVFLPLNLWESFGNEAVHQKWCQWVTKARSMEMDYRGQQA